MKPFFSKATLSTKTNQTFSPKFLGSPVSDNKKYAQTLHARTSFPRVNCATSGDLSQVVLSFRFRSIEFSKKRALPFFLAIELLTHRKCVASLSSRNVQAWKVRKGRLVGCKVVLRRGALNDFIDLLSLTFPRMEKLQAPRDFIENFFKKNTFKKYAAWSVRPQGSGVDLQLTRLKAVKNVKEYKSFPTFSLSLSELVLFYPIELGLGLHADVQRVRVNFIFSASSIEERFFQLRYNKVPVLS